MQKIHRQGSIGGGIALLIVGTILLGLFIMILALIPKPEPSTSSSIDGWLYNQIYDSNYRYEQQRATSSMAFAMIIGFFGTAVCYVMGVVLIVNGVRGKKVRENGVKSICTVEHYREVWGRRGGRHYVIEFSYKGESGNHHILTVSVGYYRIDEPIKGAKYECIVYQEDCYIDMDRFTPIAEPEDDFE